MLVPNERSAAARHPAPAAAGLGGLLHGQPDFLAKRHLEGGVFYISPDKVYFSDYTGVAHEAEGTLR